MNNCGQPQPGAARTAGARVRTSTSAVEIAEGTPARGAAEMVAIEHDTTERVVRTMVFAVPPAALAFGGWLAWGGTLHWPDLLVLAISYTLTGLGITVGYHRPPNASA